MAYRQRSCVKCGQEGVCPECEPHWQRAQRYEALYGLLGIIGEKPGPPAELTAVQRERPQWQVLVSRDEPPSTVSYVVEVPE